MLADGPAQQFFYTSDDLIQVEGQRPDRLPSLRRRATGG